TEIAQRDRAVPVVAYFVGGLERLVQQRTRLVVGEAVAREVAEMVERARRATGIREAAPTHQCGVEKRLRRLVVALLGCKRAGRVEGAGHEVGLDAVEVVEALLDPASP